MNTHDKINELLTAFALGELSPQESSDVETHLAECPRCTTELEQLRAVLECADAMSRLSADEQTCQSAKQRILEATASKQTTTPPATLKSIWRITMTTNKFKLAAAAIILIAAAIGLDLFLGGTITFADVIKPILNARTVVLDYVIGEGPDALEMHDIVIGSRIRRTMSNMDMTKILDPMVRRTLSNMDMTMILDLEDARMLTLVRLGVTKIASYNDIQGTGLEGTRSVLDFVRNVVSEVKDNPDADIQDLGEKEINGQKAVGFYVKGPNVDLTIWANKKTSLPIRIEFAEGKTSKVIKNIKFDVPLEESLVSMEVPAGYTLKDIAINVMEVPAPDNHLSNATEEDLVESLRIWAEIILDGAFPDAIGTDHFMKQAYVLGYKLGSLGLPVSEMEQLCFKYTKGMIFLQEFEFGGKWGYAGKGVKLGDADKAILWYQPEGSNTYRVIYGDLSVKDIAPQDLPK
jgi:outer membrane lipoprotein-sorting protein